MYMYACMYLHLLYFKLTPLVYICIYLFVSPLIISLFLSLTCSLTHSLLFSAPSSMTSSSSSLASGADSFGGPRALSSSHSSSGTSAVPIESLLQRGVHASVVNQIREINTYLSQVRQTAKHALQCSIYMYIQYVFHLSYVV